MTYKALQVYDKASGSVAEHRADKYTKHSRAPDEGDVVPIESDDGHAWASNKNNSGTEILYKRFRRVPRPELYPKS
jgi:hypothetical protein